MTDIVERLRNFQTAEADEAADEIESLRLRLEDIDDELDDAIRAIDRAREKANE